MGTDNLFHKRRTKNTSDLKRRQARRAPYAKVLIVCEGEKTEPHYFNGLKDYYGLNSANVEICGDCGSDPLSIIKYAKQRYLEEKEAGNAFDKVFCVFDKDTHAHYKKGLDEICNLKPKDSYVAITSVPCFEYWLLLHFKYTTKSYNSSPGNSACNQMLKELKSYMLDYTKGANDTFFALIEQLEVAKSNAVRSIKAAEVNSTDNPTTRVHELVKFLQDMRRWS